MDDCISRKAVIREIERFAGYIDDDMICRFKIAFNRIPAINNTDNLKKENQFLKCMLRQMEQHFSILQIAPMLLKAQQEVENDRE